MITRKAANEIAARKESQETYYVGRIDRKIRAAANDGSTNTEIKFYQQLPDELAKKLLAITHEHDFTATLVLNDKGDHTMAVSWETQ